MTTELATPAVPRPRFEGGQILTDQWLNRFVDWSEDAVERATQLGGWGIRNGWRLQPSSKAETALAIGPGVLVTPAGRVVALSEHTAVAVADLLDDASAPPDAGEWTATLWLEPAPPEPVNDARMTFRAPAPGVMASTVATASDLVLRLRPVDETATSPLARVSEPFAEEPGEAPPDTLHARRLAWLDAYAAARLDFAAAGRIPLGRLRLEVVPNEEGLRHVVREVLGDADRPVWGGGLDTHEQVLTAGLLELSPAAARRRLEAEGVVVAPDGIAVTDAQHWRLQVPAGAVVRLRVDHAGQLVGVEQVHANLAAYLAEVEGRLDGQDERLDRHWRRMDDLREWAWRFSILWGGVGAAFVLLVVALATTAGLDDSDIRLVLLVIAAAVFAIVTLGQRHLLALLIDRARRRRRAEEEPR